MSIMEYIFTDGRCGLRKSSEPRLFREAVDMYRYDRVVYETILMEAKGMSESKSTQDLFFEWLSSRMSAARVSEIYPSYFDIQDFCLRRNVIKRGLFELKDLNDIKAVADVVENNRVFRFSYKGYLNRMRTAIQLYLHFVKEHPEILQNNSGMKSSNADACEAIKPTNDGKSATQSNFPKVGAASESAKASQTDCEITGLDFSDIRSLAYTKPTEFSYFDETKTRVGSWTQLYVLVAKCLYDDYPEILNSFINKSIEGRGRIDFADKTGLYRLIDPKEFSDGLYIETNISATGIAGKIKNLLDNCHVDYENLRVYYRSLLTGTHTAVTRNSAVSQDSVEKTVATIKNSPEDQEERDGFAKWMRRNGFANTTIQSYLSAIKVAEDIAEGEIIGESGLFGIHDSAELQKVLRVLLDKDSFRELNTQQHNRFSAALAKLISYRSGSSDSTTNAEPESTPAPTASAVKNIVSDVYRTQKDTEEVKHQIDIPEETRLRYKAILEENFSDDGYQPGRAIFRGRVKRFYAEKFGSELTEDDERIDEIMKAVGTERDGRVYPKQDEAQSGIIKTITADISAAFESGAAAVYTEAVYEKYRQQLADELHIYSPESVAGLLPDNPHWRYDAYRGVISERAVTADLREDLFRIMKSAHVPQSYEDICKKAWYLPPAKLKNILVSTDSIVNVAQGTYFYAPYLPVCENELEELSRLLEEYLSCHGYITEKNLMRLIENNCPSIAVNTSEFTSHGLRNCLGYLLRAKFSFIGSVITLRGKELSAQDIYSEFVRERKSVTVSDLSDFSKDTGISIYWKAVFSEAVRVSSSGFVRKDQIRFDVEAADNALDEICPADYIPLRDVNLFLYFPNVGYPWNTYLLESYLLGYSRKFSLINAAFTENGMNGAMVRKSSDIKDYRSLLVEVLSKSDALTSSQAALQYIVDNGYQLRRTYKDIDAVLREARQLKEQREKQEK